MSSNRTCAPCLAVLCVALLFATPALCQGTRELNQLGLVNALAVLRPDFLISQPPLSASAPASAPRTTRLAPSTSSISNPGSVFGRTPATRLAPGPNLTSGLAGTTVGGLAGGTGIGAGSGGPGNAGVGSAGASVGK
ncbi:hypothetical protein V8C86DRAFT_3021712 [Haematococcus lacustris]